MSGNMGNVPSGEETPHDERPPMPPAKDSFSAENASLLSVSPALAPPRLRKKVPWKGKNIMVLLPWDEERGKDGKAPAPITPTEVEAKIREWEAQGYDTKGFNLGHAGSADAEKGAQGQSRNIWPYVSEVNQERLQRSFRVSIPDKRDWDAYVQELSEAKLRALGVSFGDEDPPPTISPAPSAAMSRRVSMQYPALPFSPPLPTSSASSNHMNHPNPFSPPLMGGTGLSTSQSSNPGSIASPASMHAHLQGKFNPQHRSVSQSVSFLPGEHPFGSPFQYPQAQSPGGWSPQNTIFQHARGGSPSLHNLSSMVSPSSPFSQDGYFPQGDVVSQMQQRQHILQAQLQQQQQLQLGARASPRLQEVREVEDEGTLVPSKSPSKTPEARQIRHNPSASLQKEIDDAEYHLEEQFQRQLEHEDYSPHSDHDEKEVSFEAEPASAHTRNTSSVHKGLGSSRFAISDDSDGPVLHHPQPHSRGHSLSQRPFHDSEQDTSSAAESKGGRNAKNLAAELSDIETNPSNLGTPVQDMSSSGHGKTFSNASNPWADSEANHTEDSAKPKRPGHSAKASMSTLNVAAKVFTFNPSSSFKPSQFTFNGNNFQPQQPIAAFSSFAPPLSAASSHFSNQSVSSSKGKINVAAPAFTPGQSEFSFSAAGPSFRPDAPTFTPLNANFSDSVGSAGSGSEGPRSSIFGNIDLSALGISKPSKKNKAIPIVRPDSSHSRNLDDETMEGKDGRITQGEGRIKRAKGTRDDGNSVPLFAEPSMPLSETSREQSPPKENFPTEKPLDKENSAPPADMDRAPTVPPKSVAQNSFDAGVSPEDDIPPYEFSQQKQAEDFNAARPFTSRRYGSGLPAYGFHQPSEDGEVSPIEEEPVKNVAKGHKKSNSSLSATAKPFEFRPGAFNFTFSQPAASIPAPAMPPSLPSAGLSASKYARSPSPPPREPEHESGMEDNERSNFQAALPPGAESPPHYPDREEDEAEREPTMEEIDDIMAHLNDMEMESAPRGSSPRWIQPSPTRQIQMPHQDNSSPIRLQPQNLMRSDAPSPSPARFKSMLGHADAQRLFLQNDDPFVGDSPPQPTMPFISPSPIHRLNRGSSVPASDWDDVLSETEEAKLQPRARFFDSHVNDLVGGLLAERLDPLERTLETIQVSLDMMAARAPSSRRQRRSISGALSDADDEDDENPRRSLSPRRDPKLEKIRSIVTEALNAQNASRPATATAQSSILPDSRNVLQMLEEMKEQFGQSMRLDLRGEDLRNIVEEAVERRMPEPKPAVDEAAIERDAEQRARILVLEEKLNAAENKPADEASIAREAEQRAKIALLEEKLQIAESKPLFDEAAVAREAESKTKIAHLEERLQIAEAKPIFDDVAQARDVDQKARIVELEGRLSAVESKTEEEIISRRAAEDRLAEVQRLLRISSEEETRLRESMDEREIKIREIIDERDQKVRSVEEARAKTTMRIALLEASSNNSQKTTSDMQIRINLVEAELHQSRQEVQHWRMEAERALEAAKRHSEDAEMANETNKELRQKLDTVRTQMEESIRVREGMRGKLTVVQEEMAKSAREISDENAKRAKKEQELIARQEVLDAKLQAEARTRERLELEIQRLENGEREGMRAVRESEKMESLIAELRLESHNAQKDAMRYQREFEEARESGLSEVQRTRHYMQAEIEAANNQVNVVREDLENQVLRLRADLDQVKLDADTAHEKHAMLLEEADSSKKAMIDDLNRKHADAIEDIQAQHDRQLGNTVEDAQRSEQHLLERLSLSSAKTEHLQDRVQHLEEKLEIANQAAHAAAKAARSASGSHSQPHPHARKQSNRGMELPEKISPQALRESIMVLQEQLQDRESQIETLNSQLSTVDLDAPVKISKCEDEISWLRELLSVRKADLEDIVNILGQGDFDPDAVRDAAIRLSANLQMEEQERERAQNGGSALSNLPNIAASLRDAATPRVAQAVGPLAAAWGNWRKSREPTSSVRGTSGSHSSTPSRTRNDSPSSFLGGLLTPPASSVSGRLPQPTAFGSTGQRFTAAQLANRPQVAQRGSTPRHHASNSTLNSTTTSTLPSHQHPRTQISPRKAMNLRSAASNSRHEMYGAIPSTPPMLKHRSSYDLGSGGEDAREMVGDFDASDAGFYDDEESALDESVVGYQQSLNP
ncbi:hypothetical protein B0J14DRAFT_234798 [Halenospora varia]|nr:hypothetical protein B0J14DRAFT_234798 [Halenospora varia]